MRIKLSLPRHYFYGSEINFSWYFGMKKMVFINVTSESSGILIDSKNKKDETTNLK